MKERIKEILKEAYSIIYAGISCLGLQEMGNVPPDLERTLREAYYTSQIVER